MMIKNYFYPTILILLLSFTVFFWNSDISGPMIQADESSHLLNAAAIAGFHNDFASSYHAGYSILISPAFYFADSPEQAWLFVRIINSMIYFVGVFLLLIISRQIYQGKSKFVPIVAVIATAVYPMWVIMAGYSFSQISFFTTFVFLTYIVHRAIYGKDIYWFFAGLISGFLYWIHPSGLAVSIALLIACLFEAVYKKKPRIILYTMVTIVLTIVSYKFCFVPWLHERMAISGITPSFHYPSILKAFGSLLSLSSVIEFISRSAGHFFYLTIGTIGLIWAYLINKLFGYDDLGVSVSKNLFVFLILSLLGVLALSVLLFTATPEATRLDHWMYGRYVEGVTAPLILMGAMTLSLRNQTINMVIAIITALILMMGITDYTHTARMNVSAFWQDFYIREFGVFVWALSGIAVILISSILTKIRQTAGIAFIALVFVWMSSLQINWHVQASHAVYPRTALAHIIRDNYSNTTCVAFDHKGIDSYTKHVYWFDYGFILYDFPLKRMSAKNWFNDCDGPLFSYDEKLNEVYNVDVLAKDTGAGPTLWVKSQPPFRGDYPFSIAEHSNGINRILKDGWHHLEANHVWSSANASLNLPVTEECQSKKCSADITFSVFGANSDRPVKIHLIDKDKSLVYRESLTISDSNEYQVSIPLTSQQPFQEIEISIPDATSPHELIGSSDKRVLGIALKRIELVKKIN